MPDIVRNFMGHVFGLRGDPCNLYSDSRHDTEQNVYCTDTKLITYLFHTNFFITKTTNIKYQPEKVTYR